MGDITYRSSFAGQLGDNTLVDKSTPVEVDLSQFSGTTVSQLKCGASNCLALLSNTSIIGWGDNTKGTQLQNNLSKHEGSLADGTTTNRQRAVLSLKGAIASNVSALEVGYQHSIVLTFAGTVYGWGYNYYGSVGGLFY